MKDKISPQYFSLNPITVTILNVINPATYILRESPGVNSSEEAKNFADVEESLQKFYASTEPTFFQMPLKDSIVVVLYENKFYRARVMSILTMSSGHLFKVYLLDYGKKCNVPRSCIYEIQKDFLLHPFQAVNFKLLGLEPVSLVMSSFDMSVSVGPVASWDLSAGMHLDKLKKEVCSVCIEVKAVDEHFLYGNLYMSFDDGTVRSINQDFITMNFARFNEDCGENVKKIEDVVKNTISDQNSPPVPLPATPQVMSCSQDTKFEIQDIKVAFVRPSDGKIMAESSLMKEPLDLTPKIIEESLDQEYPCPSVEEIMPASTKSPPKVIEDNLTQKIYVSPTNMIQKLRKLKTLSHHQSNCQSDSQKYAEEMAHANNNVSPMKESHENVKSTDENKPFNEIDGCTKDNPINSSSVSNLSFSSNAKSPPKQESASLSSTPEVASGMLLKLQRLKAKKFQVTEKTAADSKKDERAVPQSLDSSVSILDNSEFISSPRQLNSSPVSPQSLGMDIVCQSSTSPTRQSVDISKVKAFFRRRKLSQTFTTLEAESEVKVETNLNLSADDSNDVPNILVSEPKISISENCTEVKLSATDSTLSDTTCISQSKLDLLENCTNSKSEIRPQTKDFLMSSSPKLKRTPSNSEQFISETNLSTTIAERNSNALISSSEILEKSSSDSIPSPPQTINSEILKMLSDLSDSDDILYTLTKAQCYKSDSSDSSDIDESYAEYAKLKHSKSKQPQPIDFSSLWEKQKIPALQFGTCIPNPVLCTEEAQFSPHLYKVLQEIKFYSPSCIQSVVWPAMATSRCLIAIAPPHSGKTVAFVLPLVSVFTDEKPLVKGIGPMAIILCSSWKKAQVVADLFYFFLGDSTEIEIVTLCADSGNLKHKIKNLINSCDVLISTPFCLLQCFKKKFVNFSRCNNFIIDDGTTLMNQHKIELKHILLHFINGVRGKKPLPQIAIFADRWNSNFKLIFDKLMLMPLLLFTSFLESAIFACIPIEGHVCIQSDKKKVLLGLVKDAGKVVICTSSLHDSVDVHHFLRCEDVKTYLVNEEIEHYIADEVIKDWKSARCMTASHCLIITDQSLIRMCISNADCLVHYDVPHDSRLQFGNRFSCIAGHFKEKADCHKCICHILITKSDESYAPDLAQIIESSGGKAPQKLKEMCKRKERIDNSSGPLCSYLKSFGLCTHAQCEQRHIVNPIMDKPSVLPCAGDIMGLVTHVVDASHYYIRLLKYIDPESNKTISLTTDYASILFRLRDFYRHVTAEMEIESPVIGESYVLVEDDTLFYRIKVLDKVIPSSLTEFPKWKVLFLDEGWVKCYEKLKLYVLTDQIELPRPLAVETYVCNIITPDSCLDWNPQTNFLVCDLIKGKEIHGKIALCLGETLWLDPIVLRTKLNDFNSYVNLMKLDKQIIDFGHAKENKNHLKFLQQACSGKVPLPQMIQHTIKNEENFEEQSNVTYAFLVCDVFEEVYVSSVISPDQLYVQRAKFVKCLDELLDKINTQVENNILKKNSTHCKGMHCIAPFHEDNRYYRAVITDILSATEVQLFYADFGDSGNASRNEIYCLPEEHLLLPFQAIECELVGITAAHGGWTESAADTLYNITRDNAGDMKILILKAYSKASSYKGGNHYVVDLWHNEKNVSQQLLDAGFGIPTEIPMATISPVKPNVQEQQIDDEAFDNADTSDSEIHPDEKDAAALFCGVITGLLQPSSNKVGPAIITEVTSDDETSITASNTVCTEKLKKNSNEVGRDIKILEQQNNSMKPLITWWDTPQQLHILINLKEVKVYDLSLMEEELSFKTILAGTEYSTEERFYGKVHSSGASVFKTAHGVNIVVNKHTPFKWPRLVQDKRKLLHIKYDLFHIDDSDSDEHSGDINSNYKQNIQENEYPMEENSSSSDNEEKYVETWKKLAQYKDPYNLLE